MNSRAEEWEQLPCDPDLERNLGYEMIDLEVHQPEDNSDVLIFLPRDEDLLRDDAFVLADETAVCNVVQHR